jgi:hypothetical protein
MAIHFNNTNNNNFYYFFRNLHVVEFPLSQRVDSKIVVKELGVKCDY